MNINGNIRNRRTFVEKLRWYAYKITCLSTTNLLTILDYKMLYQVKKIRQCILT